MSGIKQDAIKNLGSDVILNKINQGTTRTHTFNVDYSEINPDFVGKFTVHYPSLVEKLQIGVAKSALLGGGGMVVDNVTDNIAHAISTLDTVIDHKPDWFNVFSPDIAYEILESVYMEYQTWVDSFRKGTESSNNRGSI